MAKMVKDPLIEILKEHIKWYSDDGNPVERAVDTVCRMSGAVTEPEVREAVIPALRELEEELGVENLTILNSRKINKRLVEIARQNLDAYDDQDDPPAVVRRKLIEVHDITESEADRIMEVAQVESEFERRVDELEEEPMPANSVSTNQ